MCMVPSYLLSESMWPIKIRIPIRPISLAESISSHHLRVIRAKISGKLMIYVCDCQCWTGQKILLLLHPPRETGWPSKENGGLLSPLRSQRSTKRSPPHSAPSRVVSGSGSPVLGCDPGCSRSSCSVPPHRVLVQGRGLPTPAVSLITQPLERTEE